MLKPRAEAKYPGCHRENHGVIAIRATIIAIKKGSWLTIHNLSWPAIDYICGTRSSDHRTAAPITSRIFYHICT
jgi:hypothetical protein